MTAVVAAITGQRMHHNLTYVLIFLSLNFLLAGNQADAQHSIISGDSLVLFEKTIKKIDKNVNFTVLPAPTYHATQKLGLMILPVIVYNLDTEDSLSPPSSSALGVYFDFYGSWLVAVNQKFFWNQNKWRAGLGSGYGHLRQKFYGIGRDTVIINNDDSNFVWTDYDGFSTTLTCYRRIVSNFFCGLEYIYSNSTLQGSDSVSSALLIQQGIEPDNTIQSVLVPSFVWDNRDNIYWSTSGFFAGINLQFANSIIFSSNDYSILSGYASGYHNLLRNSRRLTLAWYFHIQSGWGELPYDRRAMFGRGDNATGYTPGKYVNNSEVTAQAELRFDAWKFIGVGGYAGTGKVFPGFDTFGQSVWLHFAGARVYINVMPSRNLRFKLDVAVGRKDFGIYIGLGQGF